MADRFFLDPAGARRTVDAQDSSNARLRAAHRALIEVLGDHDGCWGGDDIGKNFASGYVDNADVTKKNVDATVSGLDDWSSGVDTVISGFVDLDKQNAANVDHIVADQLEHPPSS